MRCFNKKYYWSQCLAAIIFICFTVTAQAQSFESFDAFKTFIRDTVKDNLKNQSHDKMDVRIIRLDANIKLPSCPTFFNATLDHSGASESTNTVTLRCDSNSEWVLYVPVQIIHKKNVVVTSRTIMPSETITENDVELQERDSNQLHEGFYEDKQEVSGFLAARLIPAGTVLGRKNLKQTPLITRGQTVTLLLRQGQIEISLQGIAKSDGFLHENIKIMNPSSKKLIDAVVVGSGRAEVL